MTERNNEICEMSFEQLEQVSGGAILDRIVDAYLKALGARLLDAVHQPLVPPQKMTLHMR